jgi:hypothetical protein
VFAGTDDARPATYALGSSTLPAVSGSLHKASARRITARCEEALDLYEGFPTFYIKHRLRIILGCGKRPRGSFLPRPYRFVRSKVEVLLAPRAVQIFSKSERIATHLRASGNRRHTTVPEHMPSSDRRYADWTLSAFTIPHHARPELHPAPHLYDWFTIGVSNRSTAPAVISTKSSKSSNCPSPNTTM